MFDLLEKTLDEVALAIEGVIARNLRRRFPGRNNRDGILSVDCVSERAGIVAFVGKNVFCRNIGDQCLGLCIVTRLAWRQDEAERIAQGIDDGVDFGGQPAARTTDRTSFRPPFLPAACWCARTMVESIMTYSKSGSLAIMANSRSHTPSLDQREKRTNALFQLPKKAGRSRHGEPVRASHSTASGKRRLSAPVRPGSLRLPGKCGSIRSHW
uniref:Putative axonemal protein n=1 Tax=Magnetospirillum gryphiswaldense TaxID=55518 RepID=Q5D4Z6_9PROT|nr:putative axonemal protein [Magnetospirillum gryphiswaldense]CAJ30082.1 hypothetical protein mgI439 [Magnetospirillum gryphiswaldense MSR-1]